MAIRYAKIDLDNQGLVLIKGCNEDNPSFLSNGAGKSSIIESIVYVLFGRTIRGVKADDVVNKTSGCNCKVSLDLIDDDGSSYKITRYRKHKTNKNSVGFYHNLTDITPKSELELNKAIVKLLQTDYLTFTSSILYSAESFKFTQASDAEMKQAFEIMLDLGIYSKCQDEVKVEIHDINRDIQSVNLNLASIESKLQILEENKVSLVEKSKEWSKELDKEIEDFKILIKSLKKQMLELQDSLEVFDTNIAYAEKSIQEKQDIIQGYESAIAEFEDLRNRLKDLEKSSDDVTVAIRNTKQKIEDHQSDITSFQKKISRLESSKQECKNRLVDNESTIGTPCPFCGRPLEREHLQNAMDELQQTIYEYDSEINEYYEKIKTHENRLKKLSIKLEGYQDLLEDVKVAIQETRQKLGERDNIELKLDECFKQVRQLERSKMNEEKSKSSITSKIESLQTQVDFYKNKLDAARTQDNPYEVQLQSELKKIQDLETDKKSLDEKLEEHQSKVEVLQFWLKGFSNSGIKSMLLDDITPFLNERANKYLQVLSGNHVRVEFSTQTTLKSGEVRDKFQISVVNEDGGNSYISNSSGEKRRIDVAINLALQDLIASRANKKLNIMFMDEVLDTLDRQGTDSVIELLMEISKEKSSVFVISHNDDIQSYFQNFLLVTKQDGCSTIEKVTA